MSKSAIAVHTALHTVALILCVLQFLTACQKPDSGSANGGPELLTKPTKSDAVSDAVSDTFDITQHPLWIKYFAPSFANGNPSEETHSIVWKALWKSRTWHLAPMPLNKLPADKIGATYVDPKTLAQVAIHTDRKEIWIDEAEFTKLATDDDRAMLLLHEFIMGLKTIALSSPQSVCLEYADLLDRKPEDCKKINKQDPGQEKTFPASKLTQKDYSNIRSSTQKLFSRIVATKNRELSALELLRFYFENNFSSLFFSEPMEKTPLNKDQLHLAYVSLNRVNEFLPICHVKFQDQNTLKIPCKIEIAKHQKENETFIKIAAVIDGHNTETELPTAVSSGYLWKNLIHDDLFKIELWSTDKDQGPLFTIFDNSAGNHTVEAHRQLGGHGLSFSISGSEDPDTAKAPVPGQFHLPESN